jgi:kynureninase
VALPAIIGEKIARLIGAGPEQVVAGDSTSVNLFKLAAAAIKHRGPRKILTDIDNFPSDQYILQGLSRLCGEPVTLARVGADAIIDAIDADTTLVALTHVNYRTSAAYDLRAVTAAAHAHGAWVLWDLSHSTGVVPLSLDADEVDLAVGCGYKYLNGGPGAPAFCYVARRHQSALAPVVSGWMGHASPFEFSPDYVPGTAMQRYRAGTPEVLALSALDASVDAYTGVEIGLVRAKSQMLSDALIDLADRELAGCGYRVASPRDRAKRGGHVALAHPRAREITQQLTRAGVIGDFRGPDLIRLGFGPLYQRYADVGTAIAALRALAA